LNYGPNLKGLEWFIKNIFPHIHEMDNGAKFIIVGRDPQEEFVSLCKNIPGIELHANVPDVGVYYDQCGIVVVPVLSGGGTRIKILEAAMAGKPVFSTPFGAYGLEVSDGKDIMIFTCHQDFMEKLQLINDNNTYDCVRKNLYNIVKNKYSYDAFCKAMEKVVRQVSNY
jgi:glycosyltransferase involved in cell wall biosynthesis